MPDWKSELSRWLEGLNLRPAREAEIVEELAQHLDDRYEDLLASGFTETEAARTALAELNEHELLTCDLRRVESPIRVEPIQAQPVGATHMLTSLRQDFLYAVRMLWRQPVFAFIVSLTLALGIGANTALFTVLNAVLLRPLPYPESERLVEIGRVFPNSPEVSALSEAKFLYLRDNLHSFESITATQGMGSNTYLSNEAGTEYVTGLVVTADFFSVLGVSPAIGRSFTREEDHVGGERVVILGDGLWRRRFGSDPTIISKTISLNGKPFTVVGIMPPGFDYFGVSDVFFPMQPNTARPNEGHNWTVIGRLKPGSTPEQVSLELKPLFEKFQNTYPNQVIGNEGFAARSWRVNMTSSISQLLWLLFGAVTFVLLIACANVANLQLARSATRQKEMAIRIAVGGSTARLIRQLVTEGIVMALPGGFAGLLLAIWGVSTLRSFLPEGMVPRAREISLDWRVITFCLLATLGAGIVFGLAPALQNLRMDLSSSLKQSSSKLSAGRIARRLRNGLVVIEVALALVLTVGAGLLLRTFANLRGVDQGFNSSNLLTFDVALRSDKYDSIGKMNNLYERAFERLRSLPGVEDVAVTNKLPFDRWFNLPYRLSGQSDFTGSVEVRLISPDYFRAMKMDLRKGRAFSEDDKDTSEPVIIVNEAFARRNYNAEPLDQQLCVACEKYGDPAQRRIVGVVNDTKQRRLDETPPPIVFIPVSQASEGTRNTLRTTTFVVRTAGDTSSQSSVIRGELSQIDSDVPVRNVRSMQDLVDRSVAPQRFISLLLTLFAVIGLILAATGVYGVMAFTVSQRFQEIGIRMALGAQASDVRKLVVKQCMTLAAAGVLIGLVASFALTRIMKSMLFGVSANDPLTLVGVAILMTLIALLACSIPMRRATRIDPLVALRYE